MKTNQLFDYDTFNIRKKGNKTPAGYQHIKYQFIFDVKYDLRRKARLVARGDMTHIYEENYCGVVNMETLFLSIFVAIHNDLPCIAADVGNAYLNGHTKEKVYFVAGPEFGEYEGCILVVRKALYGLKTSGARWHEKFSETLRSMGFTPTKAHSDLWIKDCGSHYEYIATYVDDIMIFSKKGKEILERLKP